MELPKLVIASVLKPVTDTRMYEKIGCSIGQTKKYEVNIIGFYRKNLPDDLNIKFHPIFNFPRLNFSRVFCGIKYFFKLMELKPRCIICSTHELLIPSVIYASFGSVKIIYDVQENYFRNILYTDAFPYGIRYPIALWVRFKEYLTRPFVYKYLLAEKCYKDELLFTQNKNIIIENKAVIKESDYKQEVRRNLNIIQLIYTGTIASTTGIFECINLVKSLHNIDSSIKLKIVGYCPQKHTLIELQKSIENYDYIELIGGSDLVEHETIIHHIKTADFGLIYYPPNEANDSSIPTKLYEYLAHQLPIILDSKKIFTSITQPYPASINIDYSNYNPGKIINSMRSQNFYQTAPKSEVLWASEELKLLSIL
jgi:glycosyltransferase involved in cell wall biosynthesis